MKCWSRQFLDGNLQQGFQILDYGHMVKGTTSEALPVENALTGTANSL